MMIVINATVVVMILSFLTAVKNYHTTDTNNGSNGAPATVVTSYFLRDKKYLVQAFL